MSICRSFGVLEPDYYGAIDVATGRCAVLYSTGRRWGGLLIGGVERFEGYGRGRKGQLVHFYRRCGH